MKIVKYLKGFFSYQNTDDKERPTVFYEGNYKKWEDTVASSQGYQDAKIFEKSKQSFSKVLSGEFKCERDTVLFEDYQYSLPLLLGLIFTQKKVKRIHVLDFGGSFASCYFRNFDILQEFDIEWTVLEQKEIVDIAKSLLPNDSKLNFIKNNDLEDFRNKKYYNVILFGSSLQFFEKPSEIVSNLTHDGVLSTIILQTPVTYNVPSKITVQHVNEPIYKATYPAWHFAEIELLSWFEKDFELRYKFQGPHIVNECDNFTSKYEDYVFTRK